MNATATRVPSPTDQVAEVADTSRVLAVQNAAPEQLPAGQERQPDAEPALAHTVLQGFGEVTKAIASVMAEIKAVEKGGTNKFHDYKYARMQDILSVLTPLIGKAGLVIFQTEHHRSLFDGGNVIAVQYRFTIAHASGQVWPEHPLQTGMSFCRDKHGKYDDKALNKAHTAARKYFLLALFQIPTEDEDADSGPGKRTAAAPVPGPTGYTPPHRIEPVRGETADTWAAKYETAISHSKGATELTQWDDMNDTLLSQLSSDNPDRYARVMQVVAKVQAGFAVADKVAENTKAVPAATGQTAADPISSGRKLDPVTVPTTASTVTDVFVRPEGCPNAEQEPDKFLTWAAARLAQVGTIDELEVYWREVIDPASDGLMKPDYEELQGLHQKAEKRLGGG